MPVNELLAPDAAILPCQVPQFDQLQSGAAAAPISVGGSPFTYTNSSGGPGCVIVSGGTVTTIEWRRAGAFFVVGLLAGMYYVAAGDQLRVTYVLVPNMTFLPF